MLNTTGGWLRTEKPQC